MGRGRASRTFFNPRVRKAHSTSSNQDDSYVKPINPTGPDGKPLTCHGCGSSCHFIAACIYYFDNAQRARQGQPSVPAEKAVLFSHHKKVPCKFLVKKLLILQWLTQPVHQQCVVRDDITVISVFSQKKSSQLSRNLKEIRCLNLEEVKC